MSAVSFSSFRHTIIPTLFLQHHGRQLPATPNTKPFNIFDNFIPGVHRSRSPRSKTRRSSSLSPRRPQSFPPRSYQPAPGEPRRQLPSPDLAMRYARAQKAALTRLDYLRTQLDQNRSSGEHYQVDTRSSTFSNVYFYSHPVPDTK